MKTLSLVLKAVAEDGTFEGLAAAYGNVDSSGDRIEAGAFSASLGAQVPILFAHKTDQPIGVATVTETASGLMVRGKLLLDTVAGSEAYARIKAGILKALSVGFLIPNGGASMANGVRVIRQAILKEVSLVVFGANELAQLTAFKDADESNDNGCQCECAECAAGNCDECSDPACLEDNCTGCPNQAPAKSASPLAGVLKFL